MCILCLAGCLSTHPVGDLLDCIRPGKIRGGDVAPYGGVCIPQGPIKGPGPALPSVPAIAVPVVPPPVPLPAATAPAPAPNVPPPPVLFPSK